jgi:small-conductance mechanosensitive channel
VEEIMNVSDNFLSIIITSIVFAFFAWMFKVILEIKKTRLKSGIHHKLVEKFNNPQEFCDFFQTPGGTKFMDSLTIDTLNPKQKIISAFSKGIIIVFVGISFLILSLMFWEESRSLLAIGIIISFLGLGFLASSGLSVYLSKKWNIFNTDQK